MHWQAPIADAALEGAWRRMWGRHLLLLLGYIALFLVLFFRMQLRIADHDIFFWEQRILSRRFLIVLGIHGAVMVWWYRASWLYQWRRFLFEPLSPHNLALMRILFFGFIVSHQVFYVPGNWSALAELPTSSRQALPLIGWMIDSMPISPALYNAANIAGIVVGLFAVFGFFTRAAMLTMIPIVFYVYGVPQFFGKLSHYQFFFWITVILAFSQSFEVWSIDALLRRIRGMRTERKPHFRYALGIRWIMLTMAGIYFFSGFRKLYEAGFYWSLSDNPVNLLRTEWLEQFRDVPAVRVDQFPVLCSIAATAVIVFEMAYPFLLLGRRSRLFAALDAVLFHNLNGYFLKIDFVYLKTAHLSYLDWGKITGVLDGWKRWRAWLIVAGLVALVGNFVGVFFMFPFLLIGGVIDLSWHAVPRMRRGRLLLRLRKLLPAPIAPAKRALRQAKWLKMSMITGATMLLLNTACGAFGIHSWPFSAYPTYSFVRSSTMEYGWFLPKTANQTPLDLDTEAQKAHFRKENILPMAERIVTAYKFEPSQLPHSVLSAWLRWRLELPTLRAATTCEVVIRSYPLDPERYGEVIQETPLGHLELSAGEWIFVPIPKDSVTQPKE